MKKLRERPLQIYLRPDQDKALRQMAQTEKVSIAELVRRGVDKLLTDVPPEQDPLLELIGIGRSGIRDLSENHDYYLAQIYKDEHKSSTEKRSPNRAKKNSRPAKRKKTAA